MQCYKEVIPPSAVTASLSLPFLSSSANNLIVAKTSLLQIFAFKSVISETRDEALASQNDQPERTPRRDRAHVTKLVLVGEYEIAGQITALARISKLRSKAGADLLLVALKDAKLSLVEWDPERYSISTVSIHFYERDDLLGPAWTPSSGQSYTQLSVDPSNRCAAFKFGARQLAILPLTRGTLDDFVMDDYEADADVDGEAKTMAKRRQSSTKVNGDVNGHSSQPSSFVLSLLSLDPALTRPIRMAFLYEYREPTVGIISSRVAPSSALLPSRKDCISYTVYTLDLEQRASTTLLSVQNLPYDIHQVTPLPLPIGGALLMGYNELIHVDQAGKTNGVAVNEFAKRCSAFPLVSQEELNLKLDGCLVEQLGSSSGELLLFLRDGDLAILRFRAEGRSVSGIVVEKIPVQNGGSILHGPASCASSVGRNRLFVGSEQSDSVILGWSVKAQLVKRRQSELDGDVLGDDAQLDSDLDSLDDDDDLYGDTSLGISKGKSQAAAVAEVKAEDCAFKIHDRLLNISPLANLSTVRLEGDETANGALSHANEARLDLLAISGHDSASSIIRLSPNLPLRADKRLDLDPASRLWSLHVENLNSDFIPGKETEFHNVIVTSNTSAMESGSSSVYVVEDGKLQSFDAGDLEPDAGASVEVFTLLGGSRVIQVLSTEIRAFDGDFSLAQIIPISDETAENVEIIAASVAEPFILLQGSDHQLILLQVDDVGELEEIEDTGVLPQSRWKSGSLFDDVDDVFRLTFDGVDEEDSSSVLMFLLDIRGGLQVFRLPRLVEPAYVAPGMSFLPGFLTPEFSVRRSNARDPLEEIIVAELGDATNKTPFMILRSSNNDLIIYSPYHDSTKARSEASLQFLKLPCQFMPEAPREALMDEDEIQSKERLLALPDFQGHSAVVMTGSAPCLVLKTAASNPQVVPVKGRGTLDLSAFNTPFCPRGIAHLNSSNQIVFSHLPDQVDFMAGWTVERLYTGHGLVSFDYHRSSDRFIVSTTRRVPFKIPSDENHPEWSNEDVTMLPEGEQNTIELLDRASWTVTDTYALEPDEVVMCIKVMSLEVSELTHKRREMVVIGTAMLKGEDTGTQGTIYVFDILDVVPEPDHPETGRKLSLFAKISEKGAVTALAQIGSEGFILAAQGQKCLVRGLKEDHSLQPVAFIDVQCYTSVVKELRGTSLCMIGDAAKGLWLVGYTEEPYSLKLFGKGMNHTSVVAAEFLPDGRALQILLADVDGTVHVLQFDPHNPKSLSGQRILHVSSFQTGNNVSSMELLPRVPTSWEQLGAATETGPAALESASSHQILLASSTGALALLTLLSSSQYRSLGSLQAWLGNAALAHPFSLGPKARRGVDVDLSVGGRAILDGDVLGRWNELGSWKRAEGVVRAGVDAEWEVRAMLESVSGRGLAFL